MSATSLAGDQQDRIRIDPTTSMGTVHLTVSDLSRSRSFYEQAIGLRASENDAGTLTLSVSGERPLIELSGDASAPPLNRGATGLYHLALLMPTRRDLAHALARVAQAQWPLDGASDHLVSEALYLSDPDGNGIEIYRDRPLEQWREVDGQLQMSTLPLDLRSVLGEIPAESRIESMAPSGTRMGHVHLQVSDLERSEDFYSGILGFDVMVRGYPGALFVSAGGYHHHLGLNTWQSRGAGAPQPGAIGLRSFEVLLPSAEAVESVLERVRRAGLEVRSDANVPLVRDPSGNAVLLRSD